MKMFYAATSIMLLLCLYFVAFSPENADFVADADEDVEAELKALVIENLRATRAEDMDAMLGTLHSESPGYSQVEKIANTLFATYDLNYDLLLFRYIGQDGEYAVARFKFPRNKWLDRNLMITFLIQFMFFVERMVCGRFGAMQSLKLNSTNEFYN
jgi:hypothetical protein